MKLDAKDEQQLCELIFDKRQFFLPYTGVPALAGSRVGLNANTTISHLLRESNC